ncbi:DNA-binding protein [Ramlibacter sp.]|uniref:DNA-binding protein n=1 Tax=Ramlibacter sp. TaxID=1917967 RepID=UPI003D12D2E4
MTSPKTRDQVRSEFAAAGVTLREWARVHHVSYDVAKAVMQGRLMGARGEAHRVAVALGLKKGRVVAASEFMPPPPKQRGSRRLTSIPGGRG